MSSPGIALPLIQQQTSAPAPLESAPTGAGEGTLAAANAALEHTLGESLVTRAVGAGMSQLPGGDVQVPHDAAVKEMTDQNYDPHVLLGGSVSRGQLDAIKNQQSAIARSQDIANRSGAPGFVKTIASFTGSAGDPLFLAAGPALGRIGQAVAPEIEGAVGATGLAARGIRAGVGGGEAAGTMAAYTAAQKSVGTAQGDRDITFYDAASTVATAALFGGGIGGLTKSPVTTQDISTLERSAAAAQHQGVPVSEVVSPKGAVGEFQIMPSTAEAYGIPASVLKDPAANKHVAEMLLNELNKKYPNDPEAVAIAYNAGPKTANKWLSAGRNDAVLPQETKGYVEGFRALHGMPETPEAAETAPKLPPDTMKQAGETSLAQFIADAPINAKPTVEDALETNDGLSSSRALGADDDLKKSLTGAYTLAEQSNILPKEAAPEVAEKPTADTTEAEQMAKDAHDEAAAHAVSATGEQAPEFEALEEKIKGETSDADEQSRGLEAAVKCGVIRGFG